MNSGWTIAHDFAFDYGGAERVTEVIAEDVLPEASLRVLAGDPRVLARMGIDRRAELVLPRRVVTRRSYRHLAPLYALKLRMTAPIDTHLLSSSYAFAHHLRCRGRHVVYCHSPLRQIWSHREQYARVGGRFRRGLLTAASGALRRLDVDASTRVDRWIATSSVVARRIARFYDVPAPPVVPPPVDLDVFGPASAGRGDAFVWAGRIVEPYKRVELLIETFRQLPYRLFIAGSGRDEGRLRRRAPANVVFLGELDSRALAELYGTARALLFPSEDDFGMVPVEAMACGTPVIAFRGGGALDTVVDGETGVFFDEPSVSSLSEALDRCLRSDWDDDAIVAHASRFGRGAFAGRMRELLP